MTKYHGLTAFQAIHRQRAHLKALEDLKNILRKQKQDKVSVEPGLAAIPEEDFYYPNQNRKRPAEELCAPIEEKMMSPKLQLVPVEAPKTWNSPVTDDSGRCNPVMCEEDFGRRNPVFEPEMSADLDTTFCQPTPLSDYQSNGVF